MDNIKKDLFDLFELDKIEPEKAIKTLDSLSKLVLQAVLARVLPLLSKEDMTSYEKIIESENAVGEMISFFKEKIPDFDSIVKEESESLRIEMSKSMSQLGI